MGIRRAVRASDLCTVPLLCDPDYQARRGALIRGGGDESGIRSRAEAADADESRFAATLDPACLGVDLDGVARITFRGLTGADFARIEGDAALAVVALKLKSDAERARRLTSLMIDATLAAALVDSGVDGLPIAQSAPYPVAALSGSGGIGPLWPAYAREVYERIVTFSTLGESDGSSPAP